MLVRVSDFELIGHLRLRLAEDLGCMGLQFTGKPLLQMRLESTVHLGPAIPMPLRHHIERAVREACDSWLERNAVLPRELSVKTDRFRRKSTLTPEDVKAATLAAKEASLRCGSP